MSVAPDHPLLLSHCPVLSCREGHSVNTSSLSDRWRSEERALNSLQTIRWLYTPAPPPIYC